MFIKGKDLFFSININGVYYPICHSKTCTINTTASILPTTTFGSGNAETNDYSNKYAYTIKGDGVTYIGDVASNFVLQTLQTTFQKVLWTFTDNENVQWHGTALISSTTFDSSFDAISTFQNELIGDGEYNFIISNTPIPPINPSVNILDQFGTLIANVPAPGSYIVTRFNAIDCGAANQPPPQIIITA